MMKTINVPNEILIPKLKELLNQGLNVTIRVRGWSMRIFLDNNRDLVMLAPPQPDQLKRWDLVLAEVAPQQFVLHRIIKKNNNQLVLKGDGNVYGIERCDVNDVIGVATAFYRKGRQTPDYVTGWKWKYYSKLWMLLTPFRRIILGIYNRIYKR